MAAFFRKINWKYYAPLFVCAAAVFFLLLLPTGYEGALQYRDAERCIARVLSADNQSIVDTGLVRSGEQQCSLEILSGRFKGRTVTGVNLLTGSLEQDKLFEPGDKAMVVISHSEDEILRVSMTDLYRIDWELVMGGLFILLLLLFAGRTGLRAVLSFALTVLCLWKAARTLSGRDFW